MLGRFSADLDFCKCINGGLSDEAASRAADVDGVAIKNFRHLVEVLRDGRDEFISVEFFSKNADIIVLPRREIEKVTREVMEDNGITRRGTDDILAVWQNRKRSR